MQDSGAVRNIHPGAEVEGRLVRHLDALEWNQEGSARWACVFGSGQGAELLSLVVIELEDGAISIPARPANEFVLHILEGRGKAAIGGREFEIRPGDGVHVRRGESLLVTSESHQPLRFLMAICPALDSPWESESGAVDSAQELFDENYPARVFSSEDAGREATGDRFFKVLVGPKTGSEAVTQFVGSIPRSRAPEHFHRYEEVIFVLSGEGRIWMGEISMPVRPGSLIFLPRQQPHCMECTVDEGIELLGMFYPAGSPAVNYSSDRKKS